jgi:hypothetical protein
MRGFEVDDKLEFGRLLDWQVSGPFTLENAIDIGRRLPVSLEHLNPVGHQAAGGDEVAERIDGRQAMPGGERDDRSTVARGEEVRQHEERAIGCARKLLDHTFHLARVVSRCGKRLYRQRRRCGLDRLRIKERRRVRVEEICDARDVWSDSFQQVKPLTGNRGLEIGETGEIAAGSRQALDHAGGDRVADLDKDRGRRMGGIPDRYGDGRRIGQDHVRAQIEQLVGELARMRRVARTPAIDELDIAALYPAQRVKGLLENHDPRLPFRVIRNSHQYANAPHAIRLLRARRERQGAGAADKCDKFPPLHLTRCHRLPRRGERYR